MDKDQTDLERLICAINENDSKAIYYLLSSNQNPGCGGDGSMSVEQWEVARKIGDLVRELGQAKRDFNFASHNPLIRDHPRWKEE